MVHDFSLVFDTENPLWNNVLEIFERNESYAKKRVRGRALHHKYPRAFSRMLNESEDNDEDNLISLSYQDHFMIHYYYYTLAKEKFKSRMALAFKLMADIEVGSIKEISSIEIAEKVAKAHQEATELANEFSSNNLKGRTISEEQRKQISESLKGHALSEETRRKISATHTGHRWTEEQKARLSEQRMGHPDYLTDEGRQRIKEANRQNKLGTRASEETRKKMSKSQKGHIGAFKGKHLSEEHKAKLSAACKGKKLSEEHKKKLSEKAKGRVISQEQREKISKTLKGRKRDPKISKKIIETKKKNGTLTFTEEHKRKLSEAHKGKGKKHNKPMSEEHKEKIRKANQNKKYIIIDGKKKQVDLITYENYINNIGKNDG